MDVKSSNVLLTSTGAAKLADVGVSRLLVKTFLSDLPLVGTFAWVEPEVLMGTCRGGGAGLGARRLLRSGSRQLNCPRVGCLQAGGSAQRQSISTLSVCCCTRSSQVRGLLGVRSRG